MLLNDEEANQRINSADNLLNKLGMESQGGHGNSIVVPLHNGGRRPGDKNLPEFLKPIVGTAANLQKSEDVAEAFNISKSQVDQFKEGNRYFRTPDNELKNQIDKSLGTVQEMAIHRLMKALNILDDKINDEVKATDLSTISKDMSGIVERIRGRSSTNIANAQFIIYAPRQKSLDAYEVIEVESN